MDAQKRDNGPKHESKSAAEWLQTEKSVFCKGQTSCVAIAAKGGSTSY